MEGGGWARRAGVWGLRPSADLLRGVDVFLDFGPDGGAQISTPPTTIADISGSIFIWRLRATYTDRMVLIALPVLGAQFVDNSFSMAI